MTIKLKTFINSLIIAFAIAIAGGAVTYFGMKDFDSMKQPPLSPPSIVFPIVWTILFTLMAFGAAVIYDSENTSAPRALFFYALQLTMNFWWCILFFGFKLYLLSFIWILLLLVAVVIMTILFTRINKIAGLIQIFYIAWLAFASYLNLGVWLLNK